MINIANEIQILKLNKVGTSKGRFKKKVYFFYSINSINYIIVFFTLASLNRYRRVLETCTQAKAFKSFTRFSSFFSGASEQRVWLSAESKILVHFWTFSPVSVKMSDVDTVCAWRDKRPPPERARKSHDLKE